MEQNGKKRHSATDSEDGTVGDGYQVPFWTSTRFALAVLGFFGSVNLYAFRINLSVAMVCMVNQTAVRELAEAAKLAAIVLNNSTGMGYTTALPFEENVTVSGGCDSAFNASELGSTQETNGEFIWDRGTQGSILGAFFWGYLVTQVPGGILASRFGAKRSIFVFMLLASIATAITPFAARLHYVAAFALRVIVGLGSGMWFPGFHAFWANWAPPMERSKLLGITYAGTQLGNILTLPLAGLLCKYGFDGGWPCIFYLLGLTGFIWCLLWFWLASDMPEEHRYISKREKYHIHESLLGQSAKHEKLEWKTFPLKKILTSMPFWAILVMNTTNDWGAYTFMTQIPTYMSDVFKFDITTTGLYAALPYIGFWLICCLVGFPADWARSTGLLSTTTVRKITNTLGNAVPAILIVVMGFLDCSQAAAGIALLTVGVSCVGFVFCGYVINHVDIAPKYSGILFGMTNTVAAATGFVAPYVTGLLTTSQTRESWQVVFGICAAVFMFGAIFNLIFGSGEIQKWAVEEPETYDDGMVSIPLDDTNANRKNGDVYA